MSVLIPKQPTNDKELLVSILVSFWYNDTMEDDPELWTILRSFNNHQLRLLFDKTLEEDYIFKTFLLKSIKNCYGGSFFGPSNLSINTFLTDVRIKIRDFY